MEIAQVGAPGDAAPAANALAVNAFGFIYNGTTWDRLRSAGAIDSLGITGSLSAQAAGSHVTPGATVGAQATSGANNIASQQARPTSAANTAQTVIIDSRNLGKTLAINMVASAGTATLIISASVDNTNYITIDSIATAAATVKQYTEVTVGASTALSPLSYRYIKIVAGAAGAGNTTTMDIGMK
jgi:hypothetical protein